MGRTTNGLIKSRIATSPVRAYRFVKEGPVNGSGVEAVDGAAAIIGVSSEVDTPTGDRISVQQSGNVAEIMAGGNVAAGDFLTADAQGRAVTTDVVGVRYGGIAEVSGVLGDIITATVVLGVR